jgi:hypothetical protein
MVFTNLGRVVAFILLLSGIFHIAGGLMIAAGWLTPEQAALAVFPRRATTGAVIDRGLYAVLFGIALGILTEISYALRAQQGQAKPPT